jgi:hypothetical protein
VGVHTVHSLIEMLMLLLLFALVNASVADIWCDAMVL